MTATPKVWTKIGIVMTGTHTDVGAAFTIAELANAGAWAARMRRHGLRLKISLDHESAEESLDLFIRWRPTPMWSIRRSPDGRVTLLVFPTAPIPAVTEASYSTLEGALTWIAMAIDTKETK